ncbi:VWA domain-containing protein [Flammeovirgaceae bacterium SG7u.111]|nr:VWA domain-containing protein [Flammeovirgaceae bacterium SG7u.132]WPO36268.1 VWA domain-containing protein [Flammeovirgaceae bacterium SG7u.111]
MKETFEIAYPWVFFLAPLPLLVIWLIPPLKRRKKALVVPFLERAGAATGQKPRSGAWITPRNWFRWVSLFVLWLLLLAAASSPQLVGEPEMKVKTSRNFVITADISFSMATKDWELDGKKVTRWEALKKVLGDFIDQREGDRMALIFFGTNAYLQAPLTTELDVVKWQLDQTDVGMAGQMTSIGKAIAYSLQLFEADTLEQKVILLLTDGQDSGSEILPLDAANMAAGDSVVVYTLGIGDPTSLNSDLDEGTLKEISSLTNGKYFRAIDEEQLKMAYKELGELEPIEYEEEDYKPVTLLYYYPLMAFLVFSLVFFFVISFRNIIMQKLLSSNG